MTPCKRYRCRQASDLPATQAEEPNPAQRHRCRSTPRYQHYISADEHQCSNRKTHAHDQSGSRGQHPCSQTGPWCYKPLHVIHGYRHWLHHPGSSRRIDVVDAGTRTQQSLHADGSVRFFSAAAEKQHCCDVVGSRYLVYACMYYNQLCENLNTKSAILSYFFSRPIISRHKGSIPAVTGVTALNEQWQPHFFIRHCLK